MRIRAARNPLRWAGLRILEMAQPFANKPGNEIIRSEQVSHRRTAQGSSIKQPSCAITQTQLDWTNLFLA
jgi:hypothetical protein